MGIPKFFRYISERWPLILQKIEDDSIAEFDNLYLDMNSILHNCTHSNDDSTDILKRISDEEVFCKIFSYIDHLFQIVKPKGVFYMAIDGVAPRAKMNQQRSRRFRTAMDNEKAVQKVIDKGGVIPEGNHFDSNSITPGTEFMAKLTKHLKYFIHQKMSTDTRWSSIDVIFSGHEVPGEGEHKIMDYIRKIRSQPSYDPNTRHCLYGLDADLIVLGLSTHIPHFAILREEVVFGRSKNKKGGLELQNFFLLHLSILREYLGLEFEEIKSILKFEYDFEKILDDFILIMFVIGNDFLPNLPDLHLNKGAFPVILQTFKKVLQNLDGYINENGQIDLARLGEWFKYLAQFELLNYNQNQKVFNVEWFNKQLENMSINDNEKDFETSLKKKNSIVTIMETWINETVSHRFTSFDTAISGNIPTLEINKKVLAGNVKYFKKLVEDLNFKVEKLPGGKKYLITNRETTDSNAESEEHFEKRMEQLSTKIRSFYRELNESSKKEQDSKSEIANESLNKWKDDYYKKKLDFSLYDIEKLDDLTKNYVEGLQWVMYYYYKGCPSWSWFYRYHYAPRICDLKFGINQIISFKQDDPFTPFQQLMAVLPERSKELIPPVFRPLMYEESSPILDFYPSEVKLDKNGKAAEWEAVVLISFVDQKKLIDVMEPLLVELSPEEKARNGFGKELIFTHNKDVDEVYKTSLTGIFKDLDHDSCLEEEFVIDVPVTILYGLLPGCNIKENLLAGFPSLYTLKFESHLKHIGCYIFENPSKQESMNIEIHKTFKEDQNSLQMFAKDYVGKCIFINWPYLQESKLYSIYSSSKVYEKHRKTDESGKETVIYSPRNITASENILISSLKTSFTKRFKEKGGVTIQAITTIVKVNNVTGLIQSSNGASFKRFENEFSYFPLQLVVKNVRNKDNRYQETKPKSVEIEYPINSKLICVGKEYFGRQVVVASFSKINSLDVRVDISSPIKEPKIGQHRAQWDNSIVKYHQSYIVARILKINPLSLSRITGRFVVTDLEGKDVNVGIPLKFHTKSMKVLGYTRNNGHGWEFSEAALSLLISYKENFPIIFESLNSSGKKVPNIKNMLPNMSKDDISNLLLKIKKWLRTETSDFVKAPLETEVLTDESVKAIETYMIESMEEEHSKLIEVKILSRNDVINPQASISLLKHQTFSLGDRIVYIQEFGKIPVSSKGTVIGIGVNNKMQSIQVLFDKEISAGTKYGGILDTQRVIALDPTCILNLTKGLTKGKKAKNSISKTKAVNSNSGKQKSKHVKSLVKKTENGTTLESDSKNKHLCETGMST